MLLEPCTPATIDLVVILFINSMEIGGTVWGAPLPLIKKKVPFLPSFWEMINENSHFFSRGEVDPPFSLFLSGKLHPANLYFFILFF